MLNKFLKFGLLTASITLFSNFANAEDKQIPEAIVESYSKDFSVSKDEALKRIKIMERSNLIIQKIIDKFGEDSIAGLYFEHGKSFKLVVRTTKQGQKFRDILNFAQKDLPDLEVEVLPNSPRNSRAIKNILENQTKVLSNKIVGLQSLGYNPMEDKIVVSVYDPKIKTSSELANKYKIEKIAGLDVEMNLELAPAEPVAIVAGVDTYTPISGGCTVGFPAFASDKVTPGFITAYHCTANGTATTATLTDNSSNVTHNVTLSTPLSSANHDMAFYVAPKGTPINPKVYYREDGYLGPIYSQGRKSDLVIGSTYLCHFGRSTGTSCGLVSKVNVGPLSTSTNKTSTGQPLKICNTSQTYCNNTFIRITGDSLRCKVGDSGGPILDGTVAYGIASACNLTEVKLGATPYMNLSSLDYAYELPAVLAVAPLPQ